LGAVLHGHGRRPGSPSSRKAYFDEAVDYVDTPVYQRSEIGLREIVGPAIVEQPDTTLVLYPGQTARGTESGNVLISVG